MRRTLIVPLATVLLPCALQAQAVRGRLTTTDGGPVEGAVVELIASDGSTLLRGLTIGNGLFALPAAVPGNYRLRIERIGYETTWSQPLALSAGDTVFVPVVATEQAIALDAIRAAAAPRCLPRPGGGDVGTLWDEARKALHATVLAAQDGWLRIRAVRFVRQRVLATDAMHVEQRREIVTSAGLPFHTAPVTQLMERGFATGRGSDTVLYGPDADVLLSDQFLDAHCFHVAEGDDPDLVGLAFEPIPGRRQPDIRGTLWLDRASGELRHIEYRYVNIDAPGPTELYRGRIELNRLPGNVWAVSAWWIQSPIVVTVRGATPREDREIVERVRQDGGEVIAVLSPDGGRTRIPR